MDVMQYEDAFAERGNQFIEHHARDAACRAFEPIEQSILILFRLKLADEPRTRIRERFVIHIHRICVASNKPRPKARACFNIRRIGCLEGGLREGGR